MSLTPSWMPQDDDEDMRRRKAEIEEMMRSDRERYFREEPIQQEYRDILDRQTATHEAAVAAARRPGPFGEALARYGERKLAAAQNPSSDAAPLWPLLDGGESEAKEIFRRTGEVPANARALRPDSGFGKGDRLPVSEPARPRPLSAFDPQRYGVDVAPRRQNDPARAFEVDTPLRVDGENRVEELQGGKPERPLPIKRTLTDQINYAAQKNTVGVEVHSGGQVAKGEVGPRRKDSGPRHDHGDAADVDLYVIEDGKRRYLDSKNPEDREKMKSFIRDIVIAGATGVGHGYMNTGDGTTRRIHVGGGDPAAWRGLRKRTDPLYLPPFDWVEDARKQGATARERLLKAGAWPNPTQPLK